jgi:hypothetical protein
MLTFCLLNFRGLRCFFFEKPNSKMAKCDNIKIMRFRLGWALKNNLGLHMGRYPFLSSSSSFFVKKK